jgi:sodium transport system permease protein
MMVSMIGPMLILAMLMTGCVAVAPESIAGEKERGTFATMLITPVKRGYIAAGKVLSLSLISLLSGLCSCAGVVLSLPKLLGEDTISLSALGYGFAEYASLLGIVLSSVLLMVALVSMLSAWAKSIKEATAMISPVMIIVLLVGIGSSFLPMNEWYFFCIPLLNSAAALGSVFSMATQPLFVVITVLTNLAVAGVLMWVLSRMFCSEKIMFTK